MGPARNPAPHDVQAGGDALSVPGLALVFTVAASLGVIGLIGLRGRRRAPKGALVGLLALFGANNAIALGRGTGAIGASFEAPGLATYVVAHAAVAAFAIVFLRGDPLRYRAPALAAVIGPGLLLVGMGPSQGWRAGDAFQPATDVGRVLLNAYLVGCLAAALAESFVAWRRSAVLRRESFLLLAGTIVLIVAGPIYGFEFAVLGLSELLGTNLAAPLAGALFAVAVLRANPLPFRGPRAETAVRIPWTVPPGAYLVEETRPKYARGILLASRPGPRLAIVSEPEPRRPDLSGVETVRLPPGDRCAAVLTATVSEFLARFPSGAVLVDDLSYAATHSGIEAAAEAVARIVAGMPARASLVVSLAKLTDEERKVMGDVRAVRVRVPDVEAELAALLEIHLGGSAEPLRRAALALGKRVEDLTVCDVPHVRDHVLASLADLRAPTDEAAEEGWRRLSEALASDFEALWRTPPTDPRPSPRPATPVAVAASGKRPTPEGIPLVRAAEVLVAVGPEGPASVPMPLGPALREAFLTSLGPAGEPVYRRVIRALRMDPDTVRAEDLPKVARLAEEALADLGAAVDIEEARSDLKARARRLRVQLEGMGRKAR